MGRLPGEAESSEPAEILLRQTGITEWQGPHPGACQGPRPQHRNDPANYLDIEFKPGDIQLIHNHVILHDRTDYEDWPEPERKRHLLRLWLCPPNGRPLPGAFDDRYGGTEIGNRGGIMVPGVKLVTPMEAC